MRNYILQNNLSGNDYVFMRYEKPIRWPLSNKDKVYYVKGRNLDADFFVEETDEVIQVAYSVINISNDRETKALVEAAEITLNIAEVL